MRDGFNNKTVMFVFLEEKKSVKPFLTVLSIFRVNIQSQGLRFANSGLQNAHLCL